MGCIFCEKYEKKDEVLPINFFWAQFDKFPISPGHAEIIPVRHIPSLFDLNIAEWIHINYSIKEIVRVIESTNFKNLYTEMLKNPVNEKSKWLCEEMLNHIGIEKKPDGYNIGLNEGEAAGRTIHHLHIHIIPRYIGDVEDPRGGIRNIIPAYGNYKK